MTIRTRFAPSPTGVLHLGSVRTALFCWLYARRHGGDFVLRIEDTDLERSKAEYVDAILDGMAWLGMDADLGPFYQSRRFDRYKEVVAEWLAVGLAYRCDCSKERLDKLRESQKQAGLKTRYDGRCRVRDDVDESQPHVVRFKNPLSGQVIVEDAVKGRVAFDNEELDDLVIVRSDGSPTYNFTVVVDDYDMEISHVVRGDDHLNNTPRQINMIRALGATPPSYAHLPMILGPDGAKLSKRHGAVDIREYREAGYLPNAVLNYLVRLGWSHGDQEIFTVKQMTELFDIDDVNNSASAFNAEKMLWINQQHMQSTDASELGVLMRPYLKVSDEAIAAGPDLTDVARVFQERSNTLLEMAESCTFCFADTLELDAAAAKKHLRPVALEPIKELYRRLEEVDDWTQDRIGSVVKECAEDLDIGMGKLGQPLRVAVSGTSVSPAIDATLWLVGKQRTLIRMQTAIEFMEARAAQTS
ncbi:MAG: glutamate--tRNA ligase [Pseudomonadota bacterium]